VHFIVEVFNEDDLLWNSTSDGGRILLPHTELQAGKKYVVELSSLSSGIPTQLLNITAPSCSKPAGISVVSEALQVFQPGVC